MTKTWLEQEIIDTEKQMTLTKKLKYNDTKTMAKFLFFLTLLVLPYSNDLFSSYFSHKKHSKLWCMWECSKCGYLNGTAFNCCQSCGNPK